MGDAAVGDDAFAPRIEAFPPVDATGAPPAEVVVAQTSEGAVIALDAATGNPLWRWQTHDHWTSAASAGERVFISAATSDRPVWVEVDVPPGWLRNAGAWWNPVGSVPRIQIRPSALTALRARDGALLWRVTLYSPGASTGAVSPVYVADDVVITSITSFQSHAREVIALDPATGALRWSRQIGPLITSTGFLARSCLLGVAYGRVAVVMEAAPNEGESKKCSYAALDVATGDVLWQREQEPAFAAAAAARDSGGADHGMAYTLETRAAWPHEFVRAARRDGGDEVWRVDLDPPSGLRSNLTQLLAREGMVYLLAGSQRSIRIQALHGATGRTLWRWRLPRGQYTLYLARRASLRVQQAARTGKWWPLVRDALRLRWLHPPQPEGSPAMEAANGRLYIATPFGAFAVRARDGRTVWHAFPLVAVSHLRASSAGAQR